MVTRSGWQRRGPRCSVWAARRRKGDALFPVAGEHTQAPWANTCQGRTLSGLTPPSPTLLDARRYSVRINQPSVSIFKGREDEKRDRRGRGRGEGVPCCQVVLFCYLKWIILVKSCSCSPWRLIRAVQVVSVGFK